MSAKQQVVVILLPPHSENAEIVRGIRDRIEEYDLRLIRQEQGLPESKEAAHLRLKVGAMASRHAQMPSIILMFEGEDAQRKMDELGPILRKEIGRNFKEAVILLWSETPSHCQQWERVFFGPPKIPGRVNW